MLYRTVLQFYCSYEEANKTLSLVELAKTLGLAMLWKDFYRLDELFNSVILDSTLLEEINGFKRDAKRASLKSIQRLMQPQD